MLEFDVISLGHLPYRDALEVQRERLEAVIAGSAKSALLLVEHDPVLTLGAAFHDENLLLPRSAYPERGIEVVETDRGGDVTYHGPGQLVAYPIFDLSPIGKDLHRWLRDLEEVVIEAIAPLGVVGTRNLANSGVWVGNRKVCAMGIKVRRWVSMHGIALNCDTDLAPYRLIVPCGVRGDYGVTSLTEQANRPVTVDEVTPLLVEAFRRRFSTGVIA